MNSKQKGSGFERDVCKFLTVWATGKAKPYVFWRSPSSGGLATISNTTNTCGDIIAIRPEGEPLIQIFSLEIKTGYLGADPLKHLKKTKNETIKSFWEQCIRDSRMDNKSGMLIFRKKGSKPVVGIEGDIFEKLKTKLSGINQLILCYSNDLPDLVLMDMEDFFNIVDSKVIVSMI
jgi:Holliday junction resolvase